MRIKWKIDVVEDDSPYRIIEPISKGMTCSITGMMKNIVMVLFKLIKSKLKR